MSFIYFILSFPQALVTLVSESGFPTLELLPSFLEKPKNVSEATNFVSQFIFSTQVSFFLFHLALCIHSHISDLFFKENIVTLEILNSTILVLSVSPIAPPLHLTSSFFPHQVTSSFILLALPRKLSLSYFQVMVY